MGNSVELSRLAVAIEHDEETTRKLIHNMMDRYAQEGRGVRIIELEDSFQMCTAPEFYDTIIKVATQPKKPGADGRAAGDAVHRGLQAACDSTGD